MNEEQLDELRTREKALLSEQARGSAASEVKQAMAGGIVFNCSVLYLGMYLSHSCQPSCFLQDCPAFLP